jgi:beta-lactamase class D
MQLCTKLTKMKFGIAFLMVVFIIAGCNRNNVNNKKEYKTIFDKYKVDGCFATLDNAYNQFNVYNIKRFRDSAYSPASTFKIINSLIGLETGKIDPKEIMQWDGIKREREEWNQNHTYQSAFKNSVVWYFQEIARRVGKDTMQRYLDSLRYGSTKITGPIDQFWLNNSLTITPDEQMGIVKRVYFNQWGNLFSNRSMSILKQAMVAEQTDKYTLSYKTGLTTGKKGLPVAWVIGWIEFGGTKPKVNFFVLNIEGAVTAAEMTTLRKPLLIDLLKEEKLLP